MLKTRKEEKAGGFSHPPLHNGSEASLKHLRSCLRNKQERKLNLGLLGKTDRWLPLCELAKQSWSKDRTEAELQQSIQKAKGFWERPKPKLLREDIELYSLFQSVSHNKVGWSSPQDKPTALPPQA